MFDWRPEAIQKNFEEAQARKEREKFSGLPPVPDNWGTQADADLGYLHGYLGLGGPSGRSKLFSGGWQAGDYRRGQGAAERYAQKQSEINHRFWESSQRSQPIESVYLPPEEERLLLVWITLLVILGGIVAYALVKAPWLLIVIPLVLAALVVAYFLVAQAVVNYLNKQLRSRSRR